VHRGVLLEDRRDRHHRDGLAREIERHEGIGRDVEVEHAGRQQLGVVHLRPARPQIHLEPVSLVDAGGDRLIEATMLGLGLPIRAEIDGFGDRRPERRQPGAERDRDGE
jgi:hypothetical protein